MNDFMQTDSLLMGWLYRKSCLSTSVATRHLESTAQVRVSISVSRLLYMFICPPSATSLDPTIRTHYRLPTVECQQTRCFTACHWAYTRPSNVSTPPPAPQPNPLHRAYRSQWLRTQRRALWAYRVCLKVPALVFPGELKPIHYFCRGFYHKQS